MIANNIQMWTTTSLEQLIDIKHGWAFPGCGITDYPSDNVLVTPGSFKIGGGFKKDNKKFFIGSYPIEYLLMPNDLIVTMTDLSKGTDTLGYSALVPDDGRKYLHNQRIGLVKIKNNSIDKMFLYWLMRTYQYQHFIAASASGTTVKHTSPSSIKKYTFALPPRVIQENIASVLSALDDKIELNTQINRNLEQQAQAIFKSWFVDFEPFQEGNFINSELGLIPEGWKVGTLNEIAFYNNEKLPSSQACLDTYISTENMLPNRGGIVLASSVPSTGNITAFTKNDVLLSNIRPYFRKIWYASLAGTCSTDVLCFRAKRTVESEFLFCVMNNEKFFEFIMSGVKGTKMPRGDKKQMMSYRIIIPTNNILENYSEILKPFFEKQRRNSMESYRLATLRDTLLPKLMSGEIDVSEVEV